MSWCLYSFLDPNVVSASYHAILRKGDFSYTLGPEVQIKPNISIPDEMIEVSFRLKNNKTKKDFFLQIAKESRRYVNGSSKKPGIPLNILVLGIDSLSYANTIRKLPNVVEFLKQNNAQFFSGHTVVGDGTTPQLTAMLTGKHVEEQYEARTGKSGAKPLDGWTWIFKHLKGEFSLTAFGEVCMRFLINLSRLRQNALCLFIRQLICLDCTGSSFVHRYLIDYAKFICCIDNLAKCEMYYNNYFLKCLFFHFLPEC